METPTLEPWQGGFTTTGSHGGAAPAIASLRTTAPSGTRTPPAWKASRASSLSNEIREDAASEPV